jgi:hypothetical protein
MAAPAIAYVVVELDCPCGATFTHERVVGRQGRNPSRCPDCRAKPRSKSLANPETSRVSPYIVPEMDVHPEPPKPRLSLETGTFKELLINLDLKVRYRNCNEVPTDLPGHLRALAKARRKNSVAEIEALLELAADCIEEAATISGKLRRSSRV